MAMFLFLCLLLLLLLSFFWNIYQHFSSEFLPQLSILDIKRAKGIRGAGRAPFCVLGCGTSLFFFHSLNPFHANYITLSITHKVFYLHFKGRSVGVFHEWPFSTILSRTSLHHCKENLIGHFRVSKPLTFKTRPSAQPCLWTRGGKGAGKRYFARVWRFSLASRLLSTA